MECKEARVGWSWAAWLVFRLLWMILIALFRRL